MKTYAPKVWNKFINPFLILVFPLFFITFLNHAEAQSDLYCGARYIDTTTYNSQLVYPYSDRFGNKFLQEDLVVPRITHCDCSEFTDTQVPFLSSSFFELTFQDCAANGGAGNNIGFDDPVLGTEYRRNACKAFAYLANLITKSGDVCNPSTVNIEIIASNHPDAQGLDDEVFAVASAFYDCFREGGVQTGLAWDVINGSLDISQFETEEIFHGSLILNIDPVLSNPPFQGYYTGDDPNAIGTMHDFYTIMLHEAVHILGFNALMSINGFPDDFNSYSLFATYMQIEDAIGSGNLVPLVQPTTNDPFTWEQAVSFTYGSCLNPPIGPDMFFVAQNGGQIPIYTGDAHNDASFSHLAGDCEGPYLMQHSLSAGTRIDLTEPEMDILCSIGYEISSQNDCDCRVIGVDDYGPNCEGYFEHSLCDGGTLTINVSDVIDNDEGVDMIEHIAVEDDDPDSFVEIENGMIKFSPCGPGNYKIKYQPKSNTCDQLGNITFIHVKINPCPTDCEFTDNTPVDGGFNKNACNLICNPEVFSNSSINRSAISCACGDGFELPGWYSAIGTADYGIATLYSGSGSIGFNRQEEFIPLTGLFEAQESFYTPVNLTEGRYLYSYYYEMHRRAGSSIPIDFTLHSNIVDGATQSLFGTCDEVRLNELVDFSLGEIQEIHVENGTSEVPNFTRIGTCLNVEAAYGEQYLWIYPDAVFPSPDPGFRFNVDQVEIVEDNFSAGNDITVQCGDPIILGGDSFCMLSDVEVEYTWKDEIGNSLLTYSIRNEQDGSQTVLNDNGNPISSVPQVFIPSNNFSGPFSHIYTLERSFISTGGITLDNCLPLEDEILVTVDPSLCLDCDDCNFFNTIQGSMNLSSLIGTILPATGLSNTQLCIDGELTVDVDYSFASCVLSMQAGASIKVKSGVDLDITDTFLHGCDQMWEGIHLEGGGDLMMEGSSISDAQYSIYAQPELNGITTILNLFRNTFIDNFVGLYIPPPNNTFSDATWMIQRNVFIGADDLKTPFAGQSSASEGLPNQNKRSLAGIIFHRIPGFTSTSNFFYDMDSGISGTNSNFHVQNNSFTNIVSSSFYPNYEDRGKAFVSKSNGANTVRVLYSQFDDCESGIVSNFCGLNARGNRLNNVENGIFASLPNAGGIFIGGENDLFRNTILNAQIGIFVSHSDPNGTVVIENNTVTTNAQTDGTAIALLFNKAGSIIEDNVITVENSGLGIGLVGSDNAQLIKNDIDFGNVNQANAGILLQAARNCLLTENNITGLGTNGAENVGIDFIASPGNIFCCNETNNTYYGVRVDGGSSSESNFRGTIIGSHNTGLQLTENAILGTQTHTENKWMGAYSSGSGAVYDVDQNQALNYRFIVDAGISAFFPLNPLPPDWFSDENNPNNVDVCDPAECMIDNFVEDSPDSKKIAQGIVQTVNFTSTINWELQRYLYEKIKDASVQDPTIQAFKTASTTNTIGYFEDIETDTKDLFTADVTEIQQLKANLASIDTLLEDMVAIDLQIPGSTSTQIEQLLQAKELLASQVLSLAQTNETLSQTILTNRAVEASNVSQQNSTISVTPVYEQNEKTVNDIYLEYINKEMQGLLPPEITTLESIAQQCPLEGGNAVYEARALLATVNNEIITYDDATVCGAPKPLREIGSTEMSTTSTSKTFILYPNPASEELNISWTENIQQNALLQVLDLNGRLLSTYYLQPGSQFETIDISKLENSLYFISLQIDEETPLIQKFAVHR